MKIIFKIVLSTICTLLIVSGCKKTVNQNETPKFLNSNYVSSFPNYIINPSNYENPLDEVGELHNQTVHYVLNHLTELSSNNLLLHTQTYLRAYLSQPNFNLYDSIEKINNSNIYFNWQSPYNGNIDYIDYHYGLSNLSSNFHGFYHDLKDLAHSYDSIADLESLISNCKDIENEISLDSEMNESEKAFLQAGASVLRHSAAYWSSIAGSSTYVIMTPSFYGDFPTWVDSAFLSVYDGKGTWKESQTCDADFGGFLGGGATGCITGAPLGPGGALVGAFSGALGGMVGASIADVWSQWHRGFHYPSSPSDPYGSNVNPKMELDYDGTILEVRYFTFVRPDNIVIKNSNNEVVYSTTETLPNFSYNVNVGSYPAGTYTVFVNTNIGNFSSTFTN
jgi:hypothetical protein